MMKPEQFSDIAYIGIGGCGRNMLQSWRDRLHDHALCMALDRDQRSFQQSDEFEHRLLLARVKSKGSTVEYADSVRKEVQASMAEHLPELERFLNDRGTVILLAGLGGVVGTWASQIICNRLITMNKQVVDDALCF